MDCDVQTRDQAVNGALDAVPDATAEVSGLNQAQDSIQLSKARYKSAASKASAAITDAIHNGRNRASKVSFSKLDKPLPLAPGAAAVRPRQSRPLALTYIAITLAGLLFIGACGPVLSPKALNPSNSVASSLSNWAPLPQGLLLALLLALLGVAYTLKKSSAANTMSSSNSSSSQPLEIPAGVTVNESGVLCNKQGMPLPRGLRLAPGGQGFVLGPNDAPLPKGFGVGPGGVLVHAASGRPLPHSCGVSSAGEVLSSTGERLPDSMSVGPNSTLLAADGTLLSPDLQPVPAGFCLSTCGGFLLRPNGKPVPRGVHVGPGFRLLKPNGENLPDGVKIGPCGTIICIDGTIMCSDGHAAASGFVLNPDKTLILDPEGRPLEESYSMGPNGTLISQDGSLVTALGKQLLPSSTYSLGPLGNLLMRGEPLPAAAAFNATGRLVMADGAVLDVTASGYDSADGVPCSGQQAQGL